MPWKFDPIGGPWVAALLAIGLLAAPLLLAPRDDALPMRRRWMLVGLRVAATLLLVFAWLRPTWVSVKTEPVVSRLVILLDASRSMGVEDSIGGRSRYESALHLLNSSGPSIARIAETQEVRAYAFDEALRPLTVAEDGAIALPNEPTGGQTALGSAIDEVISREGDQRLLGFVVLSDGAQRALPPRDLSPVLAARRLSAEGAPLYAFPLGDRTVEDRPDLAIEDLLVSETAFAGAPIEARARLRVTGFPNQSVQVRLLWENAEGEIVPVDGEAITSKPGVDAYPVTLGHTPTAPGEWKLTMRAEPLEGETLTGNNEASTFVTVREGGVRVLYLVGAGRVGGAPGLEQRFVRASLAASPDIALQRVVFDYRQRRRDLTDQLAPGSVDVIVLDNLDAEALNYESWARIADFSSRGVGLAMLGGEHSFGPGGHQATPIAEVLPVALGRAERQAFGQPIRDDVHLPGPITVRPAEPFGLRHPLMRLSAGAPTQDWEKLPPLSGANRLNRNRLSASAVVLAESADANRWPMIVVAQPGLGRVMAMAGDTTWRWVMEGHDAEHRRFWRQVVLWLAKKDDTTQNQVYLQLGARRVSPGAKLEVIAGVRLGDEVNADAIQYETTVLAPSGETRTLELQGGREESTASFRETSAPGDYRVRVRASMASDGGEADVIGEAESRFLVPEIDLELDYAAAEPDLLARLANATSASGGKVLAPEELPELLEQLAEAPAEERQEVVSRYAPWATWPFFLALVALMSVEWWLRRRWGMP